MPSPLQAVFNLSELINGSQQPDYRLSDSAVYFILVDQILDEELTLIREPIGWDGAEWTLSRDPDWHGFNAEYSGQEANLKFREKAAVDFIERAYTETGPDANVLLTWGLEYGLALFRQTLAMQSLKLNLSKRILIGDELTVPCERLSLHPDIRARWDTTLSMNARTALVTDITGAEIPITPPSPAQLVLHAKRIKQTLLVPRFTEKADTDWIGYSNTGGSILQGGNPLDGLVGTNVYRDFYISLPFSREKANPDEVKEFAGSALSIQLDTPTPILTTKAQGQYNISVQVDFQVDARLQKASISIDPPHISHFYLALLFIVGTAKYEIATTLTGSPNDRFLNPRRLSGTLDLVLDLPVGMPIYCYGKLHLDPNRSNWRGTDVRASAFSSSLTIVANTTAPASTTPGYTILDILKHMGACLSGRMNIVQSSYYSLANDDQPIDGGGSHRLITSGYYLRGFLDKPLQLTMQKFMESLQAIDAIGMSYKPTDDGDILVIEPIANWYRDTEILILNSYTIIEEATDTDLLHPSANFGYSKFPDEGPQVLDEFNTKQEYIFPQTAGSPYSQVSDLIASGYAIEQTRRVQFSDTPNDSTAYDDDAFIICVDQTGAVQAGASAVTVAGKFVQTAGKASLVLNNADVPRWLAVGVTFQVAGSTANSGLFRVLSIQSTLEVSFVTTGPLRLPRLLFKTALILSRAITAESGSYTLSIGTEGSFVAERDEDFELVDGVVDPETIYNLRLAPRFNFLRHAPYLASSLVYRSGSEVIRNTFTKNNTGLRTKLRNSASGDINIDIRRTINHADNLYVADLRQPILPLWSPERIKVETRLTMDQMLYLRACYQGYHPDPFRHYGWIGLQDGDEVIKGYPIDITFTPATGKAVLTLRKKVRSLAERQGQKGCSFYSEYTFGDFELASATAIENWIEDCTFDNFQ
jgi:hypothetical protein